MEAGRPSLVILLPSCPQRTQGDGCLSGSLWPPPRGGAGPGDGGPCRGSGSGPAAFPGSK